MAQLAMAQLAINRLEIPNELLIVIKDFTWLTKERKKIMDLKLKINILFQAFFCKRCGEYYYYEFKTNAICKCR